MKTKPILAILFAGVLAFVLTGCATVQTVADRAETAIESVDWIEVTEGSLTAVRTLQKLGKVWIGLPCKFGALDADICDLYTLADSTATPAITQAQAALIAYKADRSAGNAALLQAAYDALNAAWMAFNMANTGAEAVAAVPIQ